MSRLPRSLPFLGLAVVAFTSPGAPHRTPPTLQETPVVRAVLFYSPSCPRCQEVITEDLPPLMDTYGAQLEIVGINVTFAEGQALFQAALEEYSIPEGPPGGANAGYWRHLAGRLAGHPRTAAGPDRGRTGPGRPRLAGHPGPGRGAGPGPCPERPSADAEPIPPLTLRDKLLRDPIANGLAIAVLVGMVISLGLVAYRLWSARGFELPMWTGWLFLALTLVGMAVAGYLTYVETSGATAVCGPVGDCNTVQQSRFAMLFGVIPMGLVGLAGYAAILIAWVIARADVRPHFGLGASGPPRPDRNRDRLLDRPDLPRAVRDRRHLRLVPDLGGRHDRAALAGLRPGNRGDGPSSATPTGDP